MTGVVVRVFDTNQFTVDFPVLLTSHLNVSTGWIDILLILSRVTTELVRHLTAKP